MTGVPKVIEEEFHTAENFRFRRYTIRNAEGKGVLYGVRIEDTSHMSSELYSKVLGRIGMLIQDSVPGNTASVGGAMLFRLLDYRDYERIVEITRYAIITEKLTRE